MSAADAAAPAIYAMGLCCPLGRTFAEIRDAYRRGDRAFRKERALVGPDGLPPTLATVLPLAECRDYVERLLFLFDAALADCLSQVRPSRGKCSLLLTVSRPIWQHPKLAQIQSAILQRHGSILRSVEMIEACAADVVDLVKAPIRHLRSDDPGGWFVGALDSYIHPSLLDRLAMEGRLLARGKPNGIIPGEAALVAFLNVAARRSSCGAGVFSSSTTMANVKSAACGKVGLRLREIYRAASENFAPDRLIVDLNGERWKAEAYGLAMAGVGQRPGWIELTRDPEAPTLHFGDCGVASGLLLPAIALMAPPRPHADGDLSFISVASNDVRQSGIIIERVRAHDR